MSGNRKKVRGQAWIQTNEDGTQDLVQDVIIIEADDMYEDVDVLVENIWSNDNLLSTDSPLTNTDFNEGYKYRWNGKSGNNAYYFWVYKTTDIMEPEIEVETFYGCPRPGNSIIFDEDMTVKQEYLIPNNKSFICYWADRFNKTIENYEEKYNGIARKEIVLEGSSIVGNPDKIVNSSASETNSTTVNHKPYEDDFNDLSNLISLF